MEFSKRLKQSRQDLKMTQKELSEKTGIKRTTIASYEVGNISPSFENVKILAEALGVSTDYLSGKSEYRTLVEKFDSKFDTEKIKSDVKLAQEIDALIKIISNFDLTGTDLNHDELSLIKSNLEIVLKMFKMYKIKSKF